MRTFICIEIPRAIRDRIESLQRALKQADAQVSWVKPSNVHLTLKFLGEVPESRIQDVKDAVARAAGNTPYLEIEVLGTGCFPSPENPRVLWVGACIPESLLRLHKTIEDNLFLEGFPRDAKRFSPHLTLGRVRSSRNARRVAGELLSNGFEPEKFTAREIIVMKSDTGPGGSVYTPQATVPLGKIK